MPPNTADVLVPLRTDFRFVHEPVIPRGAARFVGRESELNALTSRLLFSDGGSLLVTGYRGVGKTSFVNQVIRRLHEALPGAEDVLGPTELLDVQLNVARPMAAAELMHHVIRRLYDRLREKGLYGRLDPELQDALELAHRRTSVNMTRKMSEAFEKSFGVNEAGVGGGLAQAGLKLSMLWKRSRVDASEFEYLGYDDKAAEHDVIRLSRLLRDGYLPRTRAPRWLRRLLGLAEPTRVRLLIVFVFDELDKLEEFAAPVKGQSTLRPVIEDMLNALKNLFTTSGISFVFVAGKDVQERWLEDLGRGDSVYESVFSYDKYLPCMWADVESLCDGLVDPPLLSTTMAALPARRVFEDFKKFLLYKGRGIPRRVIRGFNEYVQWVDGRPVLAFSRVDLRRIRFYAGLQTALAQRETEWFGQIHEEVSGTQRDKRQLGAYYLVDWILRRGTMPFMRVDAIRASGQLSAKIAPAEEVAPRVIDDLLELLLRERYVELVRQTLDQTRIGISDEKAESRYRVVEARLHELGGIKSGLDEEAPPVPDASVAPESRLGRYRLFDQIAAGGMGIVYRALDEANGRLVAVKVLAGHLTGDPVALERFRREAETMKALRHPNIVSYLDVGDVNGQHYIAMEYVEGRTLAEILKQRGALGADVAVSFARPIAEALRYVHSRELVRNDVKPGNVIVSLTGRVLLMDFGTSRSVHDTAALSQTQTVPIGTPYYMAPEQFLHGAADARSDIYAFGAVVYEMLAGRRPFEGQSIGEILQAHLHQALLPPSKFAPVPEILEALVLRCLAKKPEDRYQTMDAVVSALGEAAAEVAPADVTQVIQSASEDAKRARNSSERPTEILSMTIFAPPAMIAPPLDPAATQPILVSPMLRVIAGPVPAGTTFPVERAKITIGRTRDNDIALDSNRVSRFHAAIVRGDGGWLVEDLNSGNGTIVNGEQLHGSHMLSNRDRITIGDAVLEFASGPPHT
jgi:serine/threonine protein kinase